MTLSSLGKRPVWKGRTGMTTLKARELAMGGFIRMVKDSGPGAKRTWLENILTGSVERQAEALILKGNTRNVFGVTPNLPLGMDLMCSNSKKPTPYLLRPGDHVKAFDVRDQAKLVKFLSENQNFIPELGVLSSPAKFLWSRFLKKVRIMLGLNPGVVPWAV